MSESNVLSSSDSLIVIPSDDESDSDIEFLREEQDDNLDVILVSHTPGGRPSLRGTTKGSSPQKPYQKPGVQTDCSLNRNLSISSNLDLALHIGETARTSPIDLSKVRAEETQSPGTVASSYDDDSRILESDSDTLCSVNSDMGNSNCAPNSSPVTDICSLASDSSHDQDICSLVPNASHVPDICSSSTVSNHNSVPLDFSNSLPDTGVNPGCSSLRYSDACMNSSNCQWNSNKLLTHSGLEDSSLTTSSVLTADVNTIQQNASADFNIACTSSHVGQTTSQITGIGDSPTNRIVKREPSLDLDIQPGCSSTKKSRLDDSAVEDPAFDLDSWDSVKKDLDFLNTATNAQSLSNPSSPTSASTSDHSLSNPFCRKPSSDDGSSVSRPSGGAWSVFQGTSACPILQGRGRPLASSDSTSSYTSHLPPKKQLHVRCFRQASDPGTAPTPSTSGWRSESCSSCKKSLLGISTSRCLQGHATCGACLEDIVKLVLTGKSKESLRCVQEGCDSYYPKSELGRSLPSMVVEILNDKLDNDHIEYIANMLMKNASSSTQSDTQNDTKKSPSTPISPASPSSLADDVFFKTEYKRSCSEPSMHAQHHNELPSHWEDMDVRTGPYKLTVLEPETPEYVEVALKFHASLEFPTVDVKRISRVQNPILWKYYTVKKTEMIQENDGHAVEERNLFHGTSASVVEAICKKGFDWRVCGKHGTVYGQGSYFAADASYSHQYTDVRDRVMRRRVPTGMFQSSTFQPRPLPLPLLYTSRYGTYRQVYPQAPQDLSQSSSSQSTVISHPLLQQKPAAPSGNQPSSTVPPSSPSSSRGRICSPLVPQQGPSAASSLSGQPQQSIVHSVSIPGPSQQQTSAGPHHISFLKVSVPSAQSSASQNSNTGDTSADQSGGLKLRIAKSDGNSYKVLSNSCRKSGVDDTKTSNQTEERLRKLKEALLKDKQRATALLRERLENAMKNNSLSNTGAGSSMQQVAGTSTQQAAGTSTQQAAGTSTQQAVGTSTQQAAGISTQQISSGPPNIHRVASHPGGAFGPPSFLSGMRVVYHSHSVTRYPPRNPPMLAGLSSLGDPEDGQSVKTNHRMFLAKVLVGRYTGGSAALRKPPPLDDLNDPYGKCYDSCVDHIHNPKIFVVFDSAQAYPEYLIEYEFTA